MVARNPATGGLLVTPLEMVGDAHLDRQRALLVLDGGYAQSTEAGDELLPLWPAQQDFTLAIAFTPGPDEPTNAPRQIVALGPANRPNFVLTQRDKSLTLALHGAHDQPAAKIDFELPDLKTPAEKIALPVHLAMVYTGNSLIAYADGQELARTEAPAGLLAGWQAGPLTVGGSASGQQNWRGTVEALALYHRALDPGEVERNARSYRLLLGRE
jgi:hypothetical protein